MKKFTKRALQLALAALLVSYVPLKSQTLTSSYKWAQPGAATIGEGNAVVVGNSNVFVVGTFSGSVVFGSTTVTSAGGKDIFIARYDLSGNLQAANHLGSANDDIGLAVTYVSAGYIIVGGSYNNGNILEYSVSAAFTSTTTITAPSSFPGTGAVTGLTVDGNGNVDASGYFVGTALFPDGSSGISLAAGSFDNSSFVSRSTTTFSAGTITYAGAINATSESADDQALAITYNSSVNKLYVTGYFKGTIALNSSAPGMTASGTRDIYVASVTLSPFAWTATEECQAGSSSTEGAPQAVEKADIGWGIATDANGVFVTGRVGGTSNFYNPGGASHYTMTASEQCSYIVKYPFSSSKITTPSWAYSINNPTASGSGEPWSRAIISDGNGGVYFAGEAFNNIVLHDNAGGHTLNGSASSWKGGFIARINTSGTAALSFYDVIASNSAGDGTYGHALYYSSCALYVTGQFNNSTKFGNTSITVSGNQDVFTAQLLPNMEIPLASSITCVQPIVYTASGASGYSWSVTDGFTSTSNPASDNMGTGGTYTVTLTATLTCGTTTSTFVISPAAVINADAGPDKTHCATSVQIGTAAIAGCTYSWLPTTSLSCTTCAQPFAGLNGTYTVTMTDPCGHVTNDAVVVSTGHGCRTADPGLNSASIYPNPGNGLFTLNSASDYLKEIVITDVTGRVVFTAASVDHLIPVDLSSLPNGMYFVKTSENGEQKVERIIKQ